MVFSQVFERASPRACACRALHVHLRTLQRAPLRCMCHASQDATAIGTIGFFFGWFNAFNGPFVAHWADSGLLNRRVPFFASWGHRHV